MQQVVPTLIECQITVNIAIIRFHRRMVRLPAHLISLLGFLIRNRTKLKDNARLGMMYRSLDRMDASKIAAVQNDADRFLTMLPKV